jgi:hypothetical protein
MNVDGQCREQKIPADWLGMERVTIFVVGMSRLQR